MSNALRTALDYVAQDQQQAAQERELAAIDDMGSIRRGYNAGRIGTDLNANRADQATLRALGRNDEADALQRQAVELEQRQALYAPRVDKVENIKGVGDALSWLGTQVGQGFASTQDPLAVAAGGTAVGNAVGAVPRLRALGTAIKGLSQAGAFALNQRQMTGEMYNRLQADPEAFKNMSAKEAFTTSNLYGAGAGLLETALPGAVGHALGGGAAKQVLKGSMPGAARTVGGGTLLEGTTELGQQAGQQKVHDIYNPQRDRSEDNSELLNAFAGGAAGGTPTAGMHAVANAVSRRFGGGERPAPVSTERGGTVDLKAAQETPQEGTQEARGGVKAAVKGVIDIGGAAARAAGEAGRTDHQERLAQAQDGLARKGLPAEEYDLYASLEGDPTGADQADAEAQAMNAAFARLDQMALDGDPRAEELLAGMEDPDPVAQGEAVRRAASFLKEEHDRAVIEARNARTSAFFGEALQALGRGAAKAAGAAAKAATFAGANMAEGARQTATGKRNMQGTDGAATISYEDWRALQESGEPAGQQPRHAVSAAHQRKFSVDATERRASPADPDRMSRDEMHGQLFASEAEARFPGGSADTLARITAFRLNDLTRDLLDTGTAPTETQLRVVAADMINLFGREKAAELAGRVAQTSPVQARPVLEALGGMLGDWDAQGQLKRNADTAMADRMLQLLPTQQQRALRESGEAGDLVELVRLASEKGLSKAGRAEFDKTFGAENFNRMLEIYGETLREQEAPGPTVEDAAAPRAPLSSDDIDADGEETGDFEQRQGERKLDKMSSPAMYMFYGEGEQSLRTSDGNRRNPRNPFEPERGTMSASDWKAQEADAKALGFVNDKGAAITHRPRPRLFAADSPAAAREGLAGKVAQMEKNLGVERTPEAYAKAVRAEKVEDLTVDERKALARLDDLEAKAAAGDEAAAKQLAQDARDFFADRRGQYSVDVVSAAQVLDDLGMQRAGRLALYRDMMFQEARRAANAKEPTAETRAAAADAIWQAATAHQMLVREMRGDRAGQRKLSAGERHAVARARQRIADSAQLSGVMAWARQNLGDEGVKRLERAMAGVQEQGATKAGPSASESMVDEAMQRYFERGYMVRAQSVTDRTPGVLSAGEVIEMARAGARARSAAGAAARVDGDAGATAAVEGTLLNFKQPAGRNMLGAKKGEPGDLAIPAEALVNWVRQNRREDFADNADGKKLRDKDSERSVDERFVEDLAAGISALVDSGLVQGGPYVIGADGKQQRFRGVDGVPDALQLPSMSGKEYKQEVEARAKRAAYAKAAERRKALQEIAEELGLDLRKPADLARAEEILAARQEAKRQARIGKDQSKDEPITQDPLVGLVDNAQYIRQVEPGARSFVRGAGTRVPARSTARAVRKDPQVSTPAPDPLAAPTAYAEARDANASAVARKAAERQARLERSNKSAPSDETPLQRAARLKRLEESEASRTAEEVRRSLRTGVIKETPPVTRNIGGKEVTLIEGEKYREARRPQASPTVEVNESWTADEDDVTPLDTQLFLNEGQAEFNDQRQRSGEIPRTAYENRADALRKAEDRAAPILDKLRSTVEGKPEHRQDAAGALADVRQRLRIAARKGQEGGVQYAFPLVHVLNPKVLGEVELQPQQARDFDMMRSALATLLADDKSLTPYERTQLAKALVDPMHAAKVTAANAQQVLNKGAQKYRDYRAQRLAERQAKKAAPEVAATEAPKSNQPAGAGRKRNAQGAGKYEGWKTGPTARQGSGIASDADIDAARAYVQRVLGPKIKVEFENITGYSGEWLDAEQTIRLSTITNAGIVNVARHEALHAFWSKFVEHNPKLRKTLNSLVNHEGLMRQLQRLLADEPAALEQLKDGEERLAYIHQFAMAGMLKLPHTPGTTVMAKVRKFLRRVFMMVSDTERAVDLLYSFEAGKLAGEPDAASRVIAKTLNQGNWLASNPGKLGALSTRLAGLVSPAHSILMNSVSPAAREIGRRFFANPGDERDGGEVGYLNARNQKIRQYSNVFRSAIDGLTTQQIQALTEALQNETPDDQIKDGAVREARAVMRGMFDRFYRYMSEEKGLRLGKVTKDYFPVVFDTEAVASGEFAQLLKTKYADKVQHIADVINTNRKLQAMEVGEPAPAALSVDEVVDGIVSRIAHVNSLDDAEMDPQREDGVLRPWFASGEKRVLNFLDPEDRARFQEKDLIKTVTRYIHQGVRAAEYSSRFGRNGAQLHVLLKNAEKEIEAASQEMMKSGDFKSEKARKTWANRQYANVANAAGAMEGSLGNDVSEGWRKVNSAVVVYQNIRLLPLALFSSFVDPLGIVVRGGEVKDALNAFVRGMKEVARNWGDMIREEPAERQKDEWERLAEHAGVIDSATLSHLLADEYGSVYHKGFARRTNEMMFRANGLEPWNRAMRVAATKSAVQFMLRHNQGRDQHSARWMKELGFAVGELPLDADGQLITRKDVLLRERPELTVREAEAIVDKVNSAIVRWVEGAILSPSAGQRPAWGSDPHFGMFWHLKQFAYSFHHTMLTRAKNEAGHGNYAPMGALAWYVPTMIGADITKGLMLGAGELPGYMQGYGAADWLQHGVERAGILGVGQLGLDAATDPVGVAGPMADQVWEAITDPIERTVVQAMPVNSLYSRAAL